MEKPFAAVLSHAETDLILKENEHFIAVLESAPLAPGHALVIAKREVDDFFDLNESELATLLLFAQPLSHALAKLYPCLKVGVAVLGLATRHAHLHLVPLQSAEDLNFTREKMKFPREDLRRQADRIRIILAEA